MPEDVTARHRAGGVGRLLIRRGAAPRHAASSAVPVARRPRRLPLALGVLTLVLLAAITPLAVREPGAPRVAVPLPVVSRPPPPTETPTARRTLRAVRQAAKAGPARSATTAETTPPAAAPSAAPVLLGPATGAELPALLGSYCRSAYGTFTLAVPTRKGWVCAPLGRTPVALDMDAMCRWRYGDSGRARPGSDTDPRGWRCYRDGT